MQNYLLTTLDSGTRVVTEPLPSVRSAAIGFWIGNGSRDEAHTHAGVSHFLEHLLFKGTASYSALEIAEIFDTFGGELNAATARDYTVVYARVLDEHVETALDVMTDMVFAPSLTDIDSERAVVLEEIAMVEDSPQELIFDLVTRGGVRRPRARPAGARARRRSSPRSHGARSAAFHRSRYRPDNVVVAAAGQRRPRPAREARRRHARQGRRPAGPEAVREDAVRGGAEALARLPVQADRAVPRLPLGARHRAL